MNSPATFVVQWDISRLVEQFIVKIIQYGVVYILMLCMNVFCIQITLLYGMILQLILFVVRFSLNKTLLKVPTGLPSRVHIIEISSSSTSFPFYVNDSV